MTHRGEWTAFAAATALTGVGVVLVPSWQGALWDVCRLAAVFAAVTIPLLLATRLVGRRGERLERAWLAFFLAGMPIVYVVRWLVAHPPGAPHRDLWLELLGLAAYGAVAITGWRRQPVLLAVGIAAHGVAWDSWHLYFGSAYVPAWYALGCLLVDVGLGAYLALRYAPAPPRFVRDESALPGARAASRADT